MTTQQIQLPVSELKPALAGFKHIIGKPALAVLGCIRITQEPHGPVHLQATNFDDFAAFTLERESNCAPTDLLVPSEQLFKVVKRKSKPPC